MIADSSKKASIFAYYLSSNILIVCPDHHRIIHKANPVYKRELLRFEYENGKNDELMYNFHLWRRRL